MGQGGGQGEMTSYDVATSPMCSSGSSSILGKECGFWSQTGMGTIPIFGTSPV